MRDYVRAQFEKARNRRLEEWFVLKYAVFVGSDENGDTFKEATAAEAKKAERSLVHTYFKYPVAVRWPSILKYWSPTKTFPSRTGVCHVRKKEWLKGIN